jgi:thiamine-phosphate pyrophosphorylase
MASSEASYQPVLRIIDASLNRISEGLRVLEDIARLLLNDRFLTEQLKNMRHDLLRSDSSFQQRLLQARDSKSDVGVDIEVAGDKKEREIPGILVANARRVQESLRSMEELSKIPDCIPYLDSEKFKKARFDLYSIEQALLSRLLRKDKTQRISGLYAIIDTDSLKGRSHVEAAAPAIMGGAKIIQLRDKLLSKKELLPIARQMRELCSKHNVLFVINDHLDLALAADADGLHLGQDDLPVKVARKLLPIDKLIGCSAATVEQAVAAESDGADYVAVASIYPTSSKEMAEVVGLDRLRQIKKAVSLPLVAIGGINKDNAQEVIAAGAVSIAVISAILQANNIQEAARQILDKIEKQP